MYKEWGSRPPLRPLSGQRVLIGTDVVFCHVDGRAREGDADDKNKSENDTHGTPFVSGRADRKGACALVSPVGAPRMWQNHGPRRAQRGRPRDAWGDVPPLLEKVRHKGLDPCRNPYRAVALHHHQRRRKTHDGGGQNHPVHSHCASLITVKFLDKIRHIATFCAAANRGVTGRTLADRSRANPMGFGEKRAAPCGQDAARTILQTRDARVN